MEPASSTTFSTSTTGLPIVQQVTETKTVTPVIPSVDINSLPSVPSNIGKLTLNNVISVSEFAIIIVVATTLGVASYQTAGNVVSPAVLGMIQVLNAVAIALKFFIEFLKK